MGTDGRHGSKWSKLGLNFEVIVKLNMRLGIRILELAVGHP